MKMRPFREHHLIRLLESYEGSTLPLDTAVNQYFRENKALGSKDRSFIGEHVYGIIRWLSLIDALCSGKPTWDKRFAIYANEDLFSHLEDSSIPEHVRYCVPESLYLKLVNDLGIEGTRAFCLECQNTAPITVRVNVLKADRDALLAKWRGEGHRVLPTSKAPHGITFQDRIHFTSFPEFKEGAFEMQDEGSQLVGEMVALKPGDQVLDYCSGSGGKTLAFAPFMMGKGQIYLHDIRKKALYEARKRLKRAGIQNTQIIFPDSPHLKKFKHTMDCVLVDAPCSGTGTYRRNPDMKWRFTDAMLNKLIGLQRTVFERALSFMKPDGVILYATCSVLQGENDHQVDHFLKIYSLTLVEEPFRSIPTKDNMDGFFCAKFMN